MISSVICEKRERLLALAQMRQTARWNGYANLAEFHSGAYECDHVSPWTKSANNVNCDVMLVAQDWASSEYLAAPFRPAVAEFGYDPTIETNFRLHDLLSRHLGLEFGDTYATNAFPFIKFGPMNARVPDRDVATAVSEFLLPQIDIIEPKLVLCIGLQAYNGIRRALCLKRLKLSEAIDQPIRYKKCTVGVVAHTGRLGHNGRGEEMVERDWERLKRFLSSERSK